MSTPPRPAPPGRHSSPARGTGVTRIVQTNELPDGVNALASADGKTIIVRGSLDPASRRRAMREVLTAIRRYPRLALIPAVAANSARNVLRRLGTLFSDTAAGAQQLAAAAADHVNAVALALTAVAGTAVAVTAVAVAPGHPAHSAVGGIGGPGSAGRRAGAGAPAFRLPTRPLSQLGVFEPGVPGSYDAVSQFAITVRHPPDITLYYSGWNEKFQSGFAQQAYGAGATPAVQIEPYTVAMAAIAAGRYDGYLRRYADQVRAYREPVIIGFAHEPNGTWYPWGANYVSASTWIAAWRHVVDVFRAQGADNVTWLWTVNAQGPYAAQAAQWYPGPGYVNWVGIDGYYIQPGESFSTVFGAGLAAVRGLGKPILIAETAVGMDSDQAAEIADLFAGVRENQLLGLIWFDVAQDRGPYHEDWRLEGNKPATTAFERQAGYFRS